MVAFTNVRAAIDGGSTTPTTLDASAPGFPGAGFVISERTSLSWSEDRGRVFFGVIPQRPELVDYDRLIFAYKWKFAKSEIPATASTM